MKPPQCDHGSTDYAVVVEGDPDLGTLLNNATARGCRDCATRHAEFMFRQSFVYSVAVVTTAELEAAREIAARRRAA